MNRFPIHQILNALSLFVTLTSLTAAPLHAQIGGGSETLFQFNGVDRGDKFGHAVSGGGDVNGDGVPDIIVGAPETNVGNNYTQGSVFVYSGVDGSLLHRWDGQATYHYLFGDAVDDAGDVNGDGFDDVIVGVTHALRGSLSHAGSAFVFSGADGSQLYQWDGTSIYETLGESVAGVGDVNGDGFDDVIVGAPEANAGGINAVGSAIVYSGFDGAVLYRFDGVNSFGYFGREVSAAGDVNSDGFADLMVSGPYPNAGSGTPSGSVFVYSGADGSQIYRFDGGYSIGHSLSDVGDVNADGIGDLIIGAPSSNPNGIRVGSAFVYSGADGTLLFSWDGDTPGADFGNSVADAGDMNGDGFDDFLVAEFTGEYPFSSASGAVYLYSGLDGFLLYRWETAADDDDFAASLAGIGDINDDGYPEIIVGVPNSVLAPNLVGSAMVYDFSPFLRTNTYSISATNGTVVQIEFDFPTSAAFDNFKLLISASGLGSTFYGVEIPLALDNMLGRTFLGNYPVSVFSNLHGTLDAFGDASGSITLPAGINPSLIGTTYHCAAIATPAGQLPEYSSIALPITITL